MLPGVVIAFIVGLPFSVGAFVSGLLSVLMIGYIKRNTRLKEDTVMGIVFTGFFALGLVLISRFPSNVDLMHVLFGNVLGISMEDIAQTVVTGVFVVGGILLLRKDFMLFCFDENQARAIGLNTGFLYYALLVLLALTIVTSLQTVGIILVISMLITPGAVGYLLTDRFDRMMVYAVIVSVFSCLTGTYLSYHLDGSTGGSIVLVQTIVFLLALFLAPRRGLLTRRLAMRRSRSHTAISSANPSLQPSGD